MSPTTIPDFECGLCDLRIPKNGLTEQEFWELIVSHWNVEYPSAVARAKVPGEAS